MKHCFNLSFCDCGIRSLFKDFLKPKIVKIGPIMNSGGAAQNNHLFKKKRLTNGRMGMDLVCSLTNEVFHESVDILVDRIDT